MPELPEVQTIVNDLNKKIINRRLVGFWSDTPRIFPKNKISSLKSQIKSCLIVAIHRRGKNILFHLQCTDQRGKKTRTDARKILLIHPKLTGRLLVGKEFLTNPKNYIRAIFYLDKDSMLAFSDVRKFGKIIFGDAATIENLPDIKNLGPDPLDKNFTVNKFISLIGSEKKKVKQVLLDQEVIAGIGNIYSDEALWLAKIHPFTPSNKLTKKQLSVLYHSIKKVLQKSLRVRGTSMRDYRDTDGKEGGYIKVRLVYARAGLPCKRCGTKIQRIKMNVRSAHFCPKCQKL